MILCGSSVYAATFKITPSKSKVNPNESFTISVGGDCIGRVNLSVKNGTISSSSVWVEQNYQTVNVKAGSSGTVTITAIPTAGFSDADANEYKPGAKSTTVTIAVPNNPPAVPDKTDNNKPADKPITNNSQTTTKPNNNSKPTEKPKNETVVEEKSSNNLLSSLATNVGTLVPNFDTNISDYTLELSKDIETINISAESADSKARVNGIGEIKVVPGDNIITITVIAENNEEKVYTIKAYVDESPQVYIKYKDKEVGVIRNIKDISIPEGFNEKQHKVNEYSISVFDNEHFFIICGIDDQNAKNLYTFDTEKNECINKITPITIDDHFFYLMDLEEAKEGFEKSSIIIDNKEIFGYKFKDGFDNYFLLSVMNNEGKIIDYLYETEEKTLQLYLNSAPISYGQYEELTEEVNNRQIVIYILSAFLLICVISIIILFLKLRKEKLDEKVH